MSVRLCKYGCNTALSWDTKISKFVEPENNFTIHDRPRCESLRPTANERVSLEQQEQPMRTSNNPIVTTSTVQLPKADWDKFMQDFNKVIDLLTKVSHNMALMTETYDSLVEQQRQLTRLLTRPLDEKAAEAEAHYDQDKEDGFA